MVQFAGVLHIKMQSEVNFDHKVTPMKLANMPFQFKKVYTIIYTQQNSLQKLTHGAVTLETVCYFFKQLSLQTP